MGAPDLAEQIKSARAAVLADPRSAYDALGPAVVDGHPADAVHLVLQALNVWSQPGRKGEVRPDTRSILEAEPRWAGLLVGIAGDAGVHADFRVRALTLLSRVRAPEPRAMVLDFAAHTDFEELAEIVRAYDDPALVEALLAKAPKGHRKGLEMFLGIATPKRSATVKRVPAPRKMIKRAR